MSNIFVVIGENREDPNRLLLVDEDGNHYQYVVPDGTTIPIDLDETWIVDTVPVTTDELLA
jgi:hypothetical protein